MCGLGLGTKDDISGPSYLGELCIIYVQTHQNDAFVGIYHLELQVGEVEKHEKMMESP